MDNLIEENKKLDKDEKIKDNFEILSINSNNKLLTDKFQSILMNTQINPIFSIVKNYFDDINTNKDLKSFCESFLSKTNIEIKEFKVLTPEIFSIISIIRSKFLTYNQFQLNVFTDKTNIYKFIIAFLISNTIKKENNDNQYIDDLKSKLINELIDDCASEQIDKENNVIKYFKPQYLASNLVSLFLLLSFTSIYTNIGLLYISNVSEKNIDELIESIYIKSDKVNIKISNIEGLCKEVSLSLENLIDVFEDIYSSNNNSFYDFINEINLDEKLFLTCMNHYYSGGVENKVDEIKKMDSYKMYLEKIKINTKNKKELESIDDTNEFVKLENTLKKYLLYILDIENFCKLVYLKD
jgi:hypothetical protein